MVLTAFGLIRLIIFYSVLVLKYPISVHTGNKRGAGTNANVFINVFGEFGDTGPRGLKKSQNRNKFERNQVLGRHFLYS